MAKAKGANGAIDDFVCTGCSLLCDELQVTVEGDRVTRFSPPCPLAEELLLGQHESPPECAVDGKPSPFEAGLQRAAELLSQARAPLVTGLHRATVQTQRHAVEIAERLGGLLDPVDDLGRSRSWAPLQTVGAVTATFGEVAARCDLAILWRVDPASTHPRLIERLLRNVEVMNIDADEAALVALRAMIRGKAMSAENLRSSSGIDATQLKTLADQLKSARFPVFFHDSADDQIAIAVFHLVADLNRYTRAASISLGPPANAEGAARVLAWQTGFPGAIDFSQGFPAYRPAEATAPLLLARGEVDAALVIGADPLENLPSAARRRLQAIPLIAMDDRGSATMSAASVAIGVAKFEIHSSGDVFRGDGVALPLRPVVKSSLPPAAEVLMQLAAHL